MKRGIEILICALILMVTGLVLFAPVLAAILAIVCLITYCVGHAKERGIISALTEFFKELLFGW